MALWTASLLRLTTRRMECLVEATVEQAGAVTTKRRFCLSSTELIPECLAKAARGYWVIENSLNWALDVVLRRINRGSEKASAHTTWPAFDTLPSTRSAPQRGNTPSRQPENSPDGTQTTWSESGSIALT